MLDKIGGAIEKMTPKSSAPQTDFNDEMPPLPPQNGSNAQPKPPAKKPPPPREELE
jgi:hypothetical protein